MVNDLPPHKRNVNTVFQNYALFPHMTVAQNVAFGLRMEKLPAAEITSRTGEYLELVGLAGFDKRLPVGDVGRPAAAGRPGPRPGQATGRAAPRRAARCARPQAPQADADGAVADPSPGRHDLRVRDPRPGGGPVDGDPDRHHVRRQRHPDRHPARGLRSSRRTGSWPTSWARRTSSPVRSRSDGGRPVFAIAGRRPGGRSDRLGRRPGDDHGPTGVRQAAAGRRAGRGSRDHRTDRQRRLPRRPHADSRSRRMPATSCRSGRTRRMFDRPTWRRTWGRRCAYGGPRTTPH